MEKVIHGTKSNGIIKISSAKYKFVCRKKKVNFKPFYRSSTIVNNKGTKSIIAQYNKWLKEIEEEVDKHFSQSTYSQKKVDIKLKNYIAPDGDWEKWVKDSGNYKISSQRNILDCMKIIREDKEFCELYIGKITKGDCQTFFRKLLEQRENLKKNTLIKIKQTMSSIFKSRDEEQNPTRGMNFSDLYKNSNNEIEKKEMILRDEELKIVLDKVKETKDKTFITVIYTTLFLCLRRGEVSCLRVSDIDFKNKCIHIRKSLVQVGKKQIIQNGTKNGEQRIVPLFPEIEALLKDFLAYKKEQNIPQEFDDKGKETTFLFTNKDGELYYIETFPKKFKKIINELNNGGLFDISPSFHSLRGTGISYWIMDRHIDIPIVQKFAGHKDISTTLKYYVKISDKDIRELSDLGITGDYF